MLSERRKIIITSTPDAFDNIKDYIEKAGFEPVLFSTIKIIPVSFNIVGIDFDWVIFTSKNTVKYFVPYVDRNIFLDKKIGCIGKETANTITKYGMNADFVPSTFNSKCFIEEFVLRYNPSGKFFLLPSSAKSGKTIEEGLCSKGGIARKIIVYDTVMPEINNNDQISLMKKEPFYFIIFSSPTAFKNFMKLNVMKELLVKTKTAAIGDITAEEMKKNGVTPDLISNCATFKGIIDDISNLKKGEKI